MIKRIYILLAVTALATFSKAHAQTLIDSTGLRIDSVTKSAAAIDSVRNQHSPHKASVRSAILPGWGQIYNKRYWKLPIVYGALGTTAYIFVDNLKTYRTLKFAYAARFEAALPPEGTRNYFGPYRDSAKYKMLEELYQNPRLPLESIKASRNQFRQYVDYSVLVFAIFWALNVVDAAVDAHLQSFDVSPDLSLRFKPGRSQLANTNGLSLVLTLK